MTKHKPISDTLYSIAAFVIGGTMLTAAATEYDGSALSGGLVLGGLAACAYGVQPLAGFGLKPRRSARFASAVKAITDWRVTQTGDHYTARWKERPAREFVFHKPDLLSSPVPLSVLADFVSAGKRREMNARYGSRVAMRQVGSGHRRLKIHEAWSKVWFTQTRRDRVLAETYDDCYRILLVTGYLTAISQGRAPRLIDPRPSANQIVDGAKAWWLHLFAERPRSRLLGLVRG